MNKPSRTKLSPSQQKVYQSARSLVERGPLVGVAVRDAHGRTTILRELAADLGAHLRVAQAPSFTAAHHGKSSRGAWRARAALAQMHELDD